MFYRFSFLNNDVYLGNTDRPIKTILNDILTQRKIPVMRVKDYVTTVNTLLTYTV